MYKINVLTSGKYNNVALGSRYNFFAKNAYENAKLFIELGCEITIEKFIKCGTCWAWSDCNKVENRISDEYYDTLAGGDL